MDLKIKQLICCFVILSMHILKHTAYVRHKKYYENHKQELLAKHKEYKVSLEKKKEYAKTTYLNKKEKLKKEKEQKSIETNI